MSLAVRHLLKLASNSCDTFLHVFPFNCLKHSYIFSVNVLNY